MVEGVVSIAMWQKEKKDVGIKIISNAASVLIVY
jgi:hypothetical protein